MRIELQLTGILDEYLGRPTIRPGQPHSAVQRDGYAVDAPAPPSPAEPQSSSQRRSGRSCWHPTEPCARTAQQQRVVRARIQHPLEAFGSSTGVMWEVVPPTLSLA
jgi:hypothetical protein